MRFQDAAEAVPTVTTKKQGVSRTSTHKVPVLVLVWPDTGDKSVESKLTQCGKAPQVLEPMDLVYSATRDLVGVVRAVDNNDGTADIRIGHDTLRFWAVRGQLIRPHWDGQKYAWEYLTVLRDE